MRAQELRIGNYVDTQVGVKRVVSIVSSADGSIYDIRTATRAIPGEENLFIDCELSPIPLTEELLLKCGAILFESTYDGWHFYHLKHFVFDGRKGKVCFGAFDRDSEGYNNDFEIEIEYLHQLQIREALRVAKDSRNRIGK